MLFSSCPRFLMCSYMSFSLWRDYCIQTSMPLFLGQCFWCGSFRSSHTHSAYIYCGDPNFRKWDRCLVDRRVPSQGSVALRFHFPRSFPLSRNWRRTFNSKVFGKFHYNCCFDLCIHISYLFFVYMVQNIHRFLLCIPCFCYLFQYSTNTSCRLCQSIVSSKEIRLG